MREPLFITETMALGLHRVSLEMHGGLDGIRDETAFHSALNAGWNAWNYAGADDYEVAACYAFHLAESQAFLDGNKRTSIARRELAKPALAALLRTQFPRPASAS
jgi:death-on-curing protein